MSNIVKRARGKMRVFGWCGVIKVAVSAAFYIIFLVVYFKSLQRNKHVWTQFNLRDKTKVRRESRLLKAAYRGKMESVKKNVTGVFGIVENRTLAGRKGIDLDRGKPNSDHSSQLHLAAEHPELLNVFVVEEHHEVIPYWFGAAEDGLIPKHGNTLIHIDGHNDASAPVYMPGYPFFRWPQTREELRYLMQRNDAFIQASAMAGLINRSIWVWPSWDAINHEQEYIAANLSLGWFKLQRVGNRMFCMCMRDDAGNDDDCRTFTEYGSYSFNSIDNKTGKPFDGFPVPSHRCKIKQRVWVEEVSEREALKLFGDENWIRDLKNVIIDIDEDYFGCTYAIRPLLDANISVDRIGIIDVTLGYIFCPTTLEQERESDTILQAILKMVRKTKTCLYYKKRTDKCLVSNITALTGRIVTRIQASSKHNLTRLCTHKQGELPIFVNILMSHIYKMKSKQIRRLQYVGFCSDTSPYSMIPDEDRHFGVCIGANSPNNTVILEYRTSKEEISKRSRLLTEILEKLRPSSPKFATLCRSVRDGFTPRGMFKQIETAVIKGLNQIFSSRVTYDSGLIGGKAGWSSAHMKMMQ